MKDSLFHLEAPAYDQKVMRDFYTQILGFRCKREILNGNGIVINFDGNQLVFHKVISLPPKPKHISPCHLGLCLQQESSGRHY